MDPKPVSFEELESNFDDIFDRACDGEVFLIEDMGVILGPFDLINDYD